ncbi:MAG: type II toxin-antitoxin system VapC family toxin [Solirubrobacterales bacterium]
MIALDVSALVKKYLDEDDSEWVENLMVEDPEWCGSMILASESAIAVARDIELATDLAAIDRRLTSDLDRFSFVPVDADCLVNAVEIGRAFRLRTLDSIHLAAARRFPDDCRFVTFDQRQGEAALDLGLELLAPA